MTVDADMTRLDELLAQFDGLNPEIAELALPGLRAAALQAPEPAYARVLAKVEALLPRYMQSPIKRGERAILREFYHFVDRASARLLAAGVVEDEAPADPGTQTMALVPDTHYSTRRWCLATTEDLIPREVLTAADAVQRRNYLISSVLEPLFGLMLELDRERALAWQLAFAAQPDPAPDPDVLRDLLRVWRRQESLSKEALRQASRWSMDERAWRHWPVVPEEADKLLRRHALLAWSVDPPRIGAARQLAMQAPYRDEERLLRWLRAAVGQMGASVDFFCAQSERLARPDGGLEAETEDWRRAALYREIVWLHGMLRPLLLLADMYLAAPNGPVNFALAIFGFTEEARRTWSEALLARARSTVRRLFINDLKAGRKPIGTIHALCFGDTHLEAEITGELDLFTQDFDNMKHRDEVVERLAAVYASYKEHTLMAGEIGRRYRRLARMLHEDNLRRLLSREQFAETQGAMGEVLLELSTIASSCRRYLTSRRAETLSTAELVAAEMDFVMAIRAQRAGVIYNLLQL